MESRFRNPERVQLLPFREYMRKRLPYSAFGEQFNKSGFVPEDLDLILRHYGSHYLSDADGHFKLIEQKHPYKKLGGAQEKTFGLIHRILRMGDPDRKRYVGFYLLHIAFPEMPICEHCNRHMPPREEDSWTWTPIFPVSVNGEKLQEPEFIEWLNGKLLIPSRFDSK